MPPGASVREEPPTSISASDKAAFQTLIRSGQSAAIADGEELFATIGLDFGTSSTKAIVRFPYEAGVPAVAIPAPPHCLSAGNPYLWQTVVWVDGGGSFTAWPAPGAHALHGLKQGLLQRERYNAVESSPIEGKTATSREAATAFLAFVIRYARGWLLANRPKLFSNRQPVWFVNVGLPAANFDDAGLLAKYRQVGAAGLLLANLEGEITVETARLLLGDKHVVEAGHSASDAEALGVAIIPETAAEVAGFAKSTQRARGLYLMVDVGAMTMDVCAFRLEQRSQSTDDLYALLEAQVRPLGVEAYHWFRSQGRTESGFVEQCDACLHRVVWETKQKRDPNAECWRAGGDLPVFFVGGGAQNDLHRDRMNELHQWLRVGAGNDGIRLLELPMPRNVDLPMPLDNFGRLAVAWGLSYLPSEIGAVLPPSSLDDISPRPARDLSNKYISKEMV